MSSKLGAPNGITLPFLVESPTSDDLAAGKRIRIGPSELALGILAAGFRVSPFVLNAPSEDQLRLAMQLIAEDFGVCSIDGLMHRAGTYLKEKHGDQLAIIALRMAVQLFPETVFCRGDLMMLLWRQVEKEHDRVRELCEEIVSIFSGLAAGATENMKDEEATLYIGLASLAFLGRRAEYATAKWSHATRINSSAWLSRQVKLLSSLRPGVFDPLLLVLE
jgi:hypothetical protein